MGRPRSAEAKSKTIAKFTENARKVADYDRLVEHKRILLALIREGIECGSSTRKFLGWCERARFIIANEEQPTLETKAVPECPHCGWFNGHHNTDCPARAEKAPCPHGIVETNGTICGHCLRNGGPL